MGINDPISEVHFLVSNSTLPLWRTELHELDSHILPPELPSTCDILIIETGYAGITTAYHLFDDEALTNLLFF
jgi:hypothetical protein